MNNCYQIKYTETFQIELENIIKYIAYELKNKIAAENLLLRIEEEIKKRSKNPEAFKSFKINKEAIFNWYRINVNNYSIFYTVTNQTMEVRRILYCKRNLFSIIKE